MIPELMTTQVLIDTAGALVAGDKGLLAIDEINPRCNKRFAALGFPQTEEARRSYRELIVTTPGLSECISGTILYDETICQEKTDGTSFVKTLPDAGIFPGIKVDTRTKDMAGHPGDKVTEVGVVCLAVHGPGDTKLMVPAILACLGRAE